MQSQRRTGSQTATRAPFGLPLRPSARVVVRPAGPSLRRQFVLANALRPVAERPSVSRRRVGRNGRWTRRTVLRGIWVPGLARWPIDPAEAEGNRGAAAARVGLRPANCAAWRMGRSMPNGFGFGACFSVTCHLPLKGSGGCTCPPSPFHQQQEGAECGARPSGGAAVRFRCRRASVAQAK